MKRIPKNDTLEWNDKLEKTFLKSRNQAKENYSSMVQIN